MVGPLAYIGGKNRLAAKIIALLPEHTTYVEPFAGGAQVFFHKRPSEVEVLNDLDGEIVNLLRVCQWHHEELIRHLKYTVASRSWFDLLAKTDPATLTDIQRAGRFFYLQKNCFGGLVVKQHYHYAVVQSPNFNPGAPAESRPQGARASPARADRVPTLPANLGTVRPSSPLLLHGPAVLAAEALPLQFHRRRLRSARTEPAQNPRPVSAVPGRSSRGAKAL